MSRDRGSYQQFEIFGIGSQKTDACCAIIKLVVYGRMPRAQDMERWRTIASKGFPGPAIEGLHSPPMVVPTWVVQNIVVQNAPSFALQVMGDRIKIEATAIFPVRK